jgi:hypothetical protein
MQTTKMKAHYRHLQGSVSVLSGLFRPGWAEKDTARDIELGEACLLKLTVLTLPSIIAIEQPILDGSQYLIE